MSGSSNSHGNYGNNSSSQNSWLGGNGGAPPPNHFMSYGVELNAGASGPPVCDPAGVRLVFCNGECGHPPANNAAHQVVPTGYIATSYGAATGGVVGNAIQMTPFITVQSNPFSTCYGWDIEFQMRDASGNGVEMNTPLGLQVGPPGPGYAQTLVPGYEPTISISLLSNQNSAFGSAGQPDSFIYKLSQPSFQSHNLVNYGNVRVYYQLPPGQYTAKVLSISCNCNHINQNWGYPYLFHPIAIGSGNTVGQPHSTNFTVTYPGWNGQGWSGCGPQPPLKYLCLGDDEQVTGDSIGGCLEIYDPNTTPVPVGGGVTEEDAMKNLWNMGKDIWLANDNFGYTMSREMGQEVDPNNNPVGPNSTPPYPNPPYIDGATFTEQYQGINLTTTGQPLDGLDPFPGGSNPTIQDYINALFTPYQLPLMPAFPSINNWTQGAFPFVLAAGFSPGSTPPQLPTGGVNTYEEVFAAPFGGGWVPALTGQNLGSFINIIGTGPQGSWWVNNWNPTPGQSPGQNMTGGMNHYKGVFDLNFISNLPTQQFSGMGAPVTWGGPYTNQPVVTNPTGITNPIRVWQPLHSTLSSCLACCADHDHQFDENGIQNPYYEPYITPPGWNDPNLNTPSNNQDFEDFLNGVGISPFLQGTILPRTLDMLGLYLKIKGHFGCGARWIE